MKKIFKLQIVCLAFCILEGCGKNDVVTQDKTEAIVSESEVSTETISVDDPSYWIIRGSDRTGYVSVPYDWSEEEYEYEFEGNYSLMLISPQRNAMLSLIENNYGYDPKQYDSQEPAEYIVESYVAQYESQGGAHISMETKEIDGYTFYKSIDCYPAGSYADYDYYLYTYVTFTGDRFYTVVIEGEKTAVTDVVIKMEEGFSASK